jgi:hypothetical protein
MQWKATSHERRSIMYSYCPKHMSTHGSDGIYEITPQPWVRELSEAQRAVLEPPYHAGPRPLLLAQQPPGNGGPMRGDTVSVEKKTDPDALMAGHRPRHKAAMEAGLETDAPMARAARLSRASNSRL